MRLAQLVEVSEVLTGRYARILRVLLYTRRDCQWVAMLRAVSIA